MSHRELIRLFRYNFEMRLKTADLSHGITLDGYPATLVQADELAKMFPELKMKLVALRLQVPDDIVRERAKTTGRESDRPQIVEQRIKDYHREMDAISLYFPNAKIVDPVTETSGKKKWVHFRWACAKFLWQSFHEWAGHSIAHSVWARAYYQQQRERGKDHHAAVRALAFKCIRIVFRCWKDRVVYDENKYLAALARRGSPLNSVLLSVTSTMV